MHTGFVVDSLGRAHDSQVRGRPIGRRIITFSNHRYCISCRVLFPLIDAVVRWFSLTAGIQSPRSESRFCAKTAPAMDEEEVDHKLVGEGSGKRRNCGGRHVDVCSSNRRCDCG